MKLRDFEVTLTSAFEYGRIVGREDVLSNLQFYAKVLGDKNLLELVEKERQKLENERNVLKIKGDLQK